MIEVSRLESADLDDALSLWNRNCSPYCPMDRQIFTDKFLSRGCHTLKAMDNGRLAGFASGFVKYEFLRGENDSNTPLYLTMVMADRECRRRGVGSVLVEELVDLAGRLGKDSVLASYRNPKNLSWLEAGRYEHNNCPGVAVDGAGYMMLQSLGFRAGRVECGLYYPLEDYSLPEKILSTEERLATDGIRIAFFDSARHHGFDELFDALHGEVWRKTISDNLALSRPLPVLVALDGDRVVGFAGPIGKEKSGRGYFNGIAVHPDYQRRGIARVLFSRLLGAFHDIGASYSTIFTDEENPALRLYLDIGFAIGGRFALMEMKV